MNFYNKIFYVLIDAGRFLALFGMGLEFLLKFSFYFLTNYLRCAFIIKFKFKVFLHLRKEDFLLFINV